MWYVEKGHIETQKGKLMFAGRDLAAVAKSFQTPLYLSNVTRVKTNFQRVCQTFSQFAQTGTQAIVYYAMKANGAEEILTALKDLSASIEVSSFAELLFAIELGFDPKKILFTGIGIGLHNIQAIAESGAVINIDSFSQLEQFKNYNGLNIFIRYNPGITAAYNEKLEMAGASLGAAKLGIHKDRIIEAFQLAKSYGLVPIGLHQHIGSNWFSEKLPIFFDSVISSLEVVRELRENQIEVKHINFGGGIGVRSSESMQEFPLEEYCRGIWELIKKSGLFFVSVCIEPGRYIVADSTILLATAEMVENKNGVNFIGLDCGFNTFNHKAFYGIESEILNVSRYVDVCQTFYSVVGYLGESMDVFHEKKLLPITVAGDIIALFPAGAYSASELGSYHLKQLPKQLFMEAKEKPFDIFPFCKVCPKNCCYLGAVNVLEEEYTSIVRRTGRVDVFKRKEGYYQINKQKGDPCPFLERDGFTCSIQDIKPIDCRAWPLYFGASGEVEENSISPDCPAIGFLPPTYVEELRKHLYDIPLSLREEFYSETIELGYNLERLDELGNL